MQGAILIQSYSNEKERSMPGIYGTATRALIQHYLLLEGK